ncbi:DUF6968 family protein [uncultured Sphingomonas sp.]|uniref:DUF6968 family protein n=1 Tax=uncultured Sphingomonas sp. TaxID=158754 RepID=UPI0035CC124A
MTTLIAERSVYGVVDGVEVEVSIKLHAPEVDDRDNWSCRYTFHTDCPALALKERSPGGVDGVQALVSALHGIGYDLDKSGIEWSMFPESEYTGTGTLLRLDDGFPRAGLGPGMLGAAFRKRMEHYVTAEREKALETIVANKRRSRAASS